MTTRWFGPFGNCGCCVQCGCLADPTVPSRAFSGTPTLKVEIANAPASFTYREMRQQISGVSYFVDDYTVALDVNGTYFIALPKDRSCVDGEENIGTGEIQIGTLTETRNTGTVPWVPTPAQCASPTPFSSTITEFSVNMELVYTTNVLEANRLWYQVAISYRAGMSPPKVLMRGNTRCLDDYMFNKDGNLPSSPISNNSYTGKLRYLDNFRPATGQCGFVPGFFIDFADCTLTIEDI